MQTLLRGVDKAKLPLAIKGASEQMRELFLKNMSERASKMLREDMASMGPVRLRDVEEAQMAIVVLAKDLAAKGDIVLSDKKGEDELIY
jgi:flagellar motor switch protein FliG